MRESHNKNLNEYNYFAKNLIKLNKAKIRISYSPKIYKERENNNDIGK